MQKDHIYQGVGNARNERKEIVGGWETRKLEQGAEGTSSDQSISYHFCFDQIVSILLDRLVAPSSNQRRFQV
jgi:hypothetical protein